MIQIPYTAAQSDDDVSSLFEHNDLLMWWEPKADLATVIRFNWKSVHELQDAITVFLSARLHTTAARMQGHLASKRFNSVKNLIASNPHTAEDILEYLSLTAATDVLVRVAENPACGEVTLSRLASNESAEVRMACAENSRTPITVLEALAIDENPDVRFRLAESASTPPAILRLLTDDENPYIQSRASVTLERVTASHATDASVPGGHSSSEAQKVVSFSPEIIASAS